MEIKVENMVNPPEKMRLMFEAVSGFMREERDLSTIKVSDITARAGIGKGTAYEYFSSKEELITNALMYEYSQRIQQLAKAAFEPQDFRERCYRLMDWISINRDFNHMFKAIIVKSSLGCQNFSEREKGENPPELALSAHDYIYALIDRFMKDGYDKGAFTETDIGKRSLALLTAMLEYSVVIMGPAETRYSAIGEEGLREFIYNSMIKALS